MTDTSSSIYSKNDIVTKAYLQQGELVVEFHGQTFRSRFEKNDFDKTVKELRDKLDKFTDNIELKEQIIFFLSKNWAAVIKEESANAMNSIEEWKIGLDKRYYNLKKTIDENMSSLWEAMEFQLAVKTILNIKDCNLPFAGIILGPPSSSKTVGIEMFRGTAHTFYTDSFSAKSFVSHNTSVPRDKLQEIDLLPKIKDKVFLSPELSPTFSKKDDELIEILGIFIRVLDGKGYESDTGAHGHRGYVGEFMFVWIGAAVEIPRKVHKYLSTLGPKLYFFRLPKTEKTEEEYLNQFEGEEFGVKFERIQKKVKEYLDWFERCPVSKTTIDDTTTDEDDTILVKVQWDKKKDEKKALKIIVKLAQILAHLRGTLQTWETRDTQGTEYDYSLPIIEEPDRAITQLRNLARGHALSQGRNFITMIDIPILVKVVLSTASIERVKIFDLLIKSEGGRLSTSQITKALDVSNSTAKRTMVEFKGIGIVTMTQDGEYENSEKTVILKSRFKWFLTEEFRNLRAGFTPDVLQPYWKECQSLTKLELQEKISMTDETREIVYECYYCNDFQPSNDKTVYESHVVRKHQGNPSYPSLADIEKKRITPKGKIWET